MSNQNMHKHPQNSQEVSRQLSFYLGKGHAPASEVAFLNGTYEMVKKLINAVDPKGPNDTLT